MEKIIAYTDGVSRGNPGPAAASVYVVDEKGELVTEVKKALGNAKDDFAEYYGVMLALQTLSQLYEKQSKEMQFEIKLSSELVEKQLNSEAQINQPGLVPMFIEIHNMGVSDFPNLSFTLVTKDENFEATRLVNEALEVK